jgi:hypothetical protein
MTSNAPLNSYRTTAYFNRGLQKSFVIFSTGLNVG